MNCRTVVLVVVVAFGAVWPADAQGPFPPERLTNLQVLPKDTAVRDVIATMRDMTVALGVRCPFCHVGQEGLPLDQFDFAADDVTMKSTARAMMRLVLSINRDLQQATPNSPAVTCYTCHRGAQRPVHAPPPKPGPEAGAGAAASPPSAQTSSRSS